MKYLDDLSQEIISVFTQNNKTIITAESCTAGLISSILANTPNASAVLLGGIVAYSNQIKHSVLHVCKSTLNKYGSVSIECVKEMAKGALVLSDASYAVSSTGLAGPSNGDSVKYSVGTVFIAIYSKNGGEVHQLILPGDRMSIRLQTVEIIFKLLLTKEKEERFVDERIIETFLIK